MSSNTQIHVEPPPPPPIKYQIGSQEAISLREVLGTGGTTLLQETLAALPEIRRTIENVAAGDLDWEPVQGESNCYRTKVEGVSVDLRLDGNLAQVTHAREVTVSYGSLPPSLDPALQRAVNRKVNRLLGVAMARRVSEQLKQYVKMRHSQQLQQQVKLSVANNFTLRASAYFKM